MDYPGGSNVITRVFVSGGRSSELAVDVMMNEAVVIRGRGMQVLPEARAKECRCLQKLKKE